MKDLRELTDLTIHDVQPVSDEKYRMERVDSVTRKSETTSTSDSPTTLKSERSPYCARLENQGRFCIRAITKSSGVSTFSWFQIYLCTIFRKEK